MRIVEVEHPTATPAQSRFWASRKRFRALAGGIGSGKTRAGCVEVLRQPAGSTGMVLAPTYPMMRDATMRTFLALVMPTGLVAERSVSENRIELIDGKTVLFRSADDPERLRGPNLGWFWLDEAAFMDPEVWRVMIGRVRDEPQRGWVTTTPSGFNWVYEEFAAQERPDYELIRAKTTDNQFLPPEFVASLVASYSADYYRQEVDGEFIDLAGSGLFRAEMLELVDAVPAGLRSARAWDLGATAGAGDYTAGVRMAGPDADGRWYITDVVRGQWEPAERNRIIRQTAELDGRAVEIRGPQDPGAGGKEAAQAFVRLLAGFSVRVAPVTGDKVTRADPLAAQGNAGNVRLLRGDWNRAFLDEVRAFPRGAHDDQIDAASDSFGALARGGLEALVRFG